MTLTPGERYEIVYRTDGEERTARVHYRGLGSADEMARGDQSESSVEPGSELHWFQLDGVPGYLTVHPDDLLNYELAERG